MVIVGNVFEDLIEAIALGHDIGHTPLGHEGEYILDEISTRELGERFAHNIQSVRLLMELENYGEGSNLTIQVLDAIMCHNGEFELQKYSRFFMSQIKIFSFSQIAAFISLSASHKRTSPKRCSAVCISERKRLYV